MPPRSSRPPRLAAALLLAFASACALPDDAIPREVATSILDAEDSRDTDPDSWSAQVEHDDARVRRLAARSIGRVRSTALAPLLLGRLEAETRDEVRDEIVFALGQIGSDAARGALERAAASDRPHERALALEALGKLGGLASEPLLHAGLDDADGLVRREALYALVRVRGRRVEPAPPLDDAAGRALATRIAELTRDGAADVRFAAAYALAETPLPGRRDAVTGLLASDDPAARLFAVRSLARIDTRRPDDERSGEQSGLVDESHFALDAQTIDSLVKRLDDPDVHVAAAAARTLAPHGDADVERALVRATTRADDPAAFHVRAAAVEVLALRVPLGWAGRRGATLLPAIVAALDDPSPTVRRAALVAAARVESALDVPGAAERARRAARHPDPWTRAAAMRAAVLLDRDASPEILATGLADPDARVAAAVLDAIGANDAKRPWPRRTVARAVLSPGDGAAGIGLPEIPARGDIAVRAGAVALLSSAGTSADADLLASTYREAQGPDGVELRLAALDALAAVAGDAAAPTLAEAVRDPSPAVAAAAARLAAARGLDVPAIAPDARRSSVALEIGTDVFSNAPNPRAVLETDAGVVELELFREQAPRHVASFLRLARAGFFDGLSIHRVVTGFVVQGLDPRGDGWGSGGVFLRDEINRARYARGTLGMPNAGPDTAGCQMFVTHVPTPHLDGRYTIFGRVVRGIDVIDRLEVGSTVRRITID